MIASMILATAISSTPKREMPIEVICVRDGLIVLNTFATQFVSHSYRSASFYDVVAKRRRLLAIPCYKYLNGTWEESKFRPEKK